MEVRTMVCDPVQPPQPPQPQSHPQPPPNDPPQPEKKKRVRRWHHRGFTGCSTCRRRHVRCDEASPTCRNCTRLGLECDGSQGRMTFKVYGPPGSSSEQQPPKEEQNSKSRSQSKAGRGRNRKVKKEDTAANNPTNTAVDDVVISPTVAPGPSGPEVQPKPLVFWFENPVVATEVEDDDTKVKQEQEDVNVVFVPAVQSPKKPTVFHLEYTMPPSLNCLQGRYYTHFVDQVATLLLIYDDPTNINPFRRCFPDLSQSSESVASAMEALGALHLANTSTGQDRNSHFQHAMGKYGEVVKSFRTSYAIEKRTKLPDFATCLLLALFEMMDSQNHNWTIHLKGAREIYRYMFSPTPSTTTDPSRASEINHPLRQFLVSLLSYLDVAGACATSDGTVVEGSYWRTLGGGWEYNLGIPSLSQPTPASDSKLLHELRTAWSTMMEIQAAISAFGRAKQSGWMPPEQQDLVYQDLLNRMMKWRLDAPLCLQQLDGLDPASLAAYPHPEVVEYVGCIEAYEKATNVYLYKIAGVDRPDISPQSEILAALCTRILSLVGAVAKGVGRLAALWPIFIAGRESRDPNEQRFVREMMVDMTRYGFKNVEKGLEELEKAWFKQRAFPQGWVPSFHDVRSSILIP